MATAYDVAAEILQTKGKMTAMKLQKLVYYCHAWHLVWEDAPLFNDPIQAWVNGPVTYSIFSFHRGKYRVSLDDFASAKPLKGKAKETVLSVLDFYGGMTAAQLSELTHAEDPWRLARGTSLDGESSSAIITPESMKDYYLHLSESEDAVHRVEDINFPAWAR